MNPPHFDVFLSHNSKDKPAVRQLAEALKNRGLNVWLDEWELIPGRSWINALGEIIETVRAAAVLVGKDGMGPWEVPEMEGCLIEFVNRAMPVIPVLLPDAPEMPELPLFLKRFTWVDLRGGVTDENLNRLIWGITGNKPEHRLKRGEINTKELEKRGIKTALQIQVENEGLETDLYDGFLLKTLNYKERWENYRYKATLSFVDEAKFSPDVRAKYYQATIDLRYETQLRKDKFLFTCVPTIDEYNKLLRDESYQERWVFPPTKEFAYADETTFDVEYINVGGLELNIKRQVDSDGKRFLVVCEHSELKNKIGTRVTIHYRYKVLIHKFGHLFMVTLVYPTKGVAMELDFAETEITYMNVLDFFVSTENPIIRYSPSRQKPHKIEVEVNEWVFPKGGVVFVWVLRPELSKSYLQLFSRSKRQKYT